MTVNSRLQEVWNVTLFIYCVQGLIDGLTLYTYIVFLYDHFGNTVTALQTAVILIIIARLSMVFFEVPTGVIGDHYGRRTAIIWSFVFQGIAFFFRALIYFNETFTGSFILAVLANVTYAIGFTFISGSLEAWVVDTLRVHEIKEGYGEVLARGHVYKFGSQIIAAAVGLWLYLSGYIVYAFSIASSICLVSVVFCWTTMEETPSMTFYKGSFFVRESIQRMKVILTTGIKVSIQTPPVAFLIILFTCYMFLTNVINFLWPIAMKENFGIGKMTPMWYFIVFFGLILSIVGSKLLQRLNQQASSTYEKKISNTHLITYIFLVVLLVSSSVVILGITTQYAHTHLILFITVLSITRFGFGFFSPGYKTLINNYIPVENSQERATIMSLATMLSSLMTALLMFPSSGSSGKTTTVGWIVPGSILFGVAIIVYFAIRRYQKKIGEIPIKSTIEIV